VKTKVYDCEGESLGGEWVNLASTEEATKEAVLQILYLDATIKAQLETAYEMKSLATLERLAALEHEQWAHWTRYMLNNITIENVNRWGTQIETPYSELTEEEKGSDRQWARKVLEAISQEK